MRSAAATAVREGSAIGLVDLDGRPRLIMAGAFSDPGANPLALQAAQQHFLSSLTSAVERIRAAYPHADVLDALNVAGHAIRAACPYGGHHLPGGLRPAGNRPGELPPDRHARRRARPTSSPSWPISTIFRT